MILPLDDGAYGTQSTTYTGTAGSVTGFPPTVRRVLVWCTTDAYVKVGENVTATSASTPMPAGVPMLLGVPEQTRSPWRVSAIQISSGGTVYAKPCA